jgi:trimeric autotransporter adhesin
VKLAGCPAAIATCRASASASTLSESSSVVSTSRGSGADRTWASSVAPTGALPRTTAAFGTPSATASARPASRSGVCDRARCPACRPASTIVAVIGVMYPPPTSAGFHVGAIPGPVNSDESTTTRDTVPSPALRASAASVATRAAPSYVVGLPAGAADSVGSPPPTSTTSPGLAPLTSRVVSRWSGVVTDSSATEVASFAVDAGVTYVPEPRSNSTAPVSASTTTAETRSPSRSSASGPASTRAMPAAVCGTPVAGAASTGAGVVSGLGVGLAVAAAVGASPPAGSRPAR